MDSALVTIVTVTFNLLKEGRESFFRQCLESVHKQTYKNVEHIVIDGGSQDGTLQLLNEYAGQNRISFVSEPDSGIYDAMNKGILMAKGKYVAFLNSDDYFHDDKGIEESVRALETTNSAFSYAPARIVNEDGTDLYYKHPHTIPMISWTFHSMPFCHQTMFTRRDILLKESMFDTTYKSAGDYDLVIRLCLKKYDSVAVDLNFTTFRFGGMSIKQNELSCSEVAQIYYVHYHKLTDITIEECQRIIGSGFLRMPISLAKALREYRPYFSYEEYLEDNLEYCATGYPNVHKVRIKHLAKVLAKKLIERAIGVIRPAS